MTRRPSHAQAARELAERDTVLERLVEAVGLPALRPPSESHVAALARAIVYQQLAGSAASAIHGRMVGVLGGDVTAENLARTATEELRSVGLSANKTRSLQDLASKVLDGTVVLDGRRLARIGDEELIEELSTVRGIGRWTAQMFLIFQLRRLDVWPAGDLGVRRGYGLAWGVSMPSERELEPIGGPYSPYRSVVAWYCWRACEVYADAAPSPVTG